MRKMDEFGGNWITTYTGKKFHYLEPRPEEIDIRDIAHALSLKVRYCGHCLQFYSVGEHSMRVADLLPKALQLEGLLHDAAEAYMPDVPRPIKYRFGLKEFEDKIEEVIRVRFGLVKSPLVKEADNVLLATEARDLMPNMDGWAELPLPLSDKIRPFSSDMRLVEEVFLAKFELYWGGRQ